MNEYQKSSAHDLADILMQYGRMYDLYEYRDTVDDSEQAAAEIEAKLAKGEIEPFVASLEQNIEELSDAYGMHAVAELTLMLLHEYKESFFPSHSLNEKLAKAKKESNHQTFEHHPKIEPDRR